MAFSLYKQYSWLMRMYSKCDRNCLDNSIPSPRLLPGLFDHRLGYALEYLRWGPNVHGVCRAFPSAQGFDEGVLDTLLCHCCCRSYAEAVSRIQRGIVAGDCQCLPNCHNKSFTRKWLVVPEEEEGPCLCPPLDHVAEYSCHRAQLALGSSKVD